MALIEWQKDYSVGVKELDEQHKKMFNIINIFYELMKKGQDKENLKGILNELVDYGKYHFSTEEGYFEKFNYPEKEEHKQNHKAYKNKIAEFVFQKNDITISFGIIDYLENWWLGHINGIDKKYTKFFNDHGLF